MHITIAGLGPAGTALTLSALTAGHTVTAWEPAGHATTPGTLAAWEHQLPTWARGTTSTCWIQTDSHSYPLPWRYSLINTAALHTALTSYTHTGQFTLIPQPAPQDRRGRPTVDFDTTPHPAPTQLRQLAVGVILPLSALPAAHQKTVLMDWTEPTPSPHTPPSFNYRLLLDDHRILIEETIVATPSPADDGLLEKLRHRLDARLHHLGVEPTVAPLGTEEVDFPLLRRGQLWTHRHKIGRYTMNPATGYSVGSAFELAPRLIHQLSQRRRTPTHGLNLRLNLGIRTARLLQARCSLAGASLSSEHTRQLYDYFFSLPPARQHDFFTSTNPAAIGRVMWNLVTMAEPGLRRKLVTASLLGR